LSSTRPAAGSRFPGSAAALGGCALLYLATPYLPVPGGVLAAAGAVVLSGFLFVVPATAVLQRRPARGALLAAGALVAAAGVALANRSLYDFRTPPPAVQPFMVEEADRVVFVDAAAPQDAAAVRRTTYPKRHWLAKTLVIDVLLLAAATAGGALIARQIVKPSHLVAVAVLGAAVDLWSVSAGVTKEITASPHTCYYFLLNWPLPGKGGVTYPLIGATDFLFVALFLTTVRRFGLPLARNVAGLAAAMTASVLSAVLLGRGLPALPFLGAAALAVNHRALRPDRKELVQIAIGTAAILAVLFLLGESRR
jgi:hypothetical protein